MNGKKAKAIRKLAESMVYDENGKYKTTPELKVLKKTPKYAYVLGGDGRPQVQVVNKITYFNANKYQYRLYKKKYKRGQLSI